MPDEFDVNGLIDNPEINSDPAELIMDTPLSASAASFTLEWPTSVVRIQSGSEVSLYGYVQDGQAGEELQVQIRHLESGQYWRPDGTFGDVMNHQANVVDSSGHWRLMHTPQAAGEYEMVVVYTDAEGSTGVRSTTFNVLGDTYVNPFAVSEGFEINGSTESVIDQSSILLDLDPSTIDPQGFVSEGIEQSAPQSLAGLDSGETLMIVGQTFQQEYQDFITGVGLTPAGSSHYATFYLGQVEQGDDSPNLQFLDYVSDNNLGDYALVALSFKDNTRAGGYGQMIDDNRPDFNPNAVHDALVDVVSGQWDSQIDQFAQSMADRPDTQFLLRVGYEVSLLLFGYQGDDYVVNWINQQASSGVNVFDDPGKIEYLNTDAYVNAYNYVVQRIRETASNVEFGYHPVRGYNDTQFLYPGADNVDWVGFSVFNNDVGMEVNGVFNAVGSMIDPNLARSIQFAQSKGHDIVIAEAAAQFPATSDSSQFIEYLSRLDGLIESYDVRALAYINSDWPSKGWGPEWGDSRVEVNDDVREYFLSTFGEESRYLYSGGSDVEKDGQPLSMSLGFDFQPMTGFE